eukprot:GHRR01001044.1.p2 GENE.GHRR01001044.1~~GHRR01001044.1.p2  ORF type:complete len:183 (+),score=80.68 GHRR01001044.1:1621-2169(+)
MEDTTASSRQTFSAHYHRLQQIEEKVVRAVEASGFVMSELSKTREETDKQLLHAAATGFVEQIQEAQQLVLKAIKTAAPERNFEANNYFSMIQAMVAAEKLDAMSAHVSAISQLLRHHKPQQQQQQPPEQQPPDAIQPQAAEELLANGANADIDHVLMDGFSKPEQGQQQQILLQKQQHQLH